MEKRRSRAVVITAIPGPSDPTALLVDRVTGSLSQRGVETTVLDLTTRPARALLGRLGAYEVDTAVAATAEADVVVAITPVRRGTYAGLLKVFLELLPPRTLAGKRGMAIGVGPPGARHRTLEAGLLPLLTEMGADVVESGVYATPEELAAEEGEAALARVERAVTAAVEAARSGRRTAIGRGPA